MANDTVRRWIPRERDYTAESASRHAELRVTRRDPLDASKRSPGDGDDDDADADVDPDAAGGDAFDNAAASGASSSGAGAGASGPVAVSASGAPSDDPLSMAALEASLDPLSAASSSSSGGASDPLAGGADASAAGADASGVGGGLGGGGGGVSGGGGDNADEEANPFAGPDFLPWDAHATKILEKYTTSKMITLVTKADDIATAASTASKAEGADAAASAAAAAAAASEKTASRLAQLDDTAEGEERKVLQMSQKEYTSHIRHLKEELKMAWSHDERVKAIKIAIQTSKFLSDPSVPQFYPSMFVLVAEVLDTFGRLVYGRILTRANELNGSRLPENFTADMVPAEARETCRNWFYKIASIRELLPRVYVELAMLRSYRFIAEKGDFPVILARLVAMVRGVGDPLVAAFARTYLAHVGIAVAPHARDYLISNVTDMFLVFRPQLTGKKFRAAVEERNMALIDYYGLLDPALDWTLQCAGHASAKEVFFAVVDRYVKHCGSAIALHAIFKAFPSALVSAYAGKMMELVKGADYASFPKYRLYAALCECLVEHPPPKKDRLGLLSDVWKVVRKFDDVTEFVEVARVFVAFPLKYFSPREVNTVLGDVYKKVHFDRRYEGLLPQLHAMLHTVLGGYTFSRVLRMDNFLPLVDLFQNQTDIARSLLAAYCASPEPTSDAYMIQTMFDCAKTVHDAVSSTSTEDERRDTCALLCSFVHHVEFGLDFERHLNFLVECRQYLPGFDAVKGRLVSAACTLAMKTLRVVRGKHSKKTLAFVKACAAYCFITVPSMDDVFGRLSLYTLSAQVCLANGLVAQAEACLRGAITTIPEVPPFLDDDAQIRPTDPVLRPHLAALIGALVAAPGHPEQGPYFLVHGLLKAIKGYKFADGSSTRLLCYVDIIALLCAQYQRRLPCGYRGVMSNDELFGGDPAFQAETLDLIDTLLEEVVAALGELDSDPAGARVQCEVATALLARVLTSAAITSKTAPLAVNLAKMALRNAQRTDKVAIRGIVDSLRSVDDTNAESLRRRLLSKIDA